MTTRTLILCAATEALALLAAVYFEPSCAVRGHLHGEAFFDGRSTSWWRRELGHWEVQHWGWGNPGYFYFRKPTRFEDWLEPLTGKNANPLGDRPRLLSGNAEAVPVLRALLDDPSPEIRRFARIGLKIEPVAP
jgi:hypothetical protein